MSTEKSEQEKPFTFQAELLKSGQRKASDLTQRYTLTIETNDPRVLDLGKLPYDTLFDFTVEVSGDKVRK